MSLKKAILQPAFVLHSRPFRDTSLLVDLLTYDHGRLRVVARGARSTKSKFRGILSPFLPLLVSYSGKTDLGTLQHAEVSGARYDFLPKILLLGFYLNELLIKLLPTHENYSAVYQKYQDTLAALTKTSQPEIELRLFEKCLLSNLGYGLQLDKTMDHQLILPERAYTFAFGHGFSLARIEHPDNFLGQNLLALHCETLSTVAELRDAKRLLRSVLAILLDNKPIKSRELF
jgi:DNA repair protein RecO (recombination protein O)